MPTDVIGSQILPTSVPPVGTVLAFLKSLTGTPTLPDGWVECNGQTLNDADSVYDGVVIPNLNASGGGTQRFLRGATTSGTTSGADTVTLTTTELPAHSHTYDLRSSVSGDQASGVARRVGDGTLYSGAGSTNSQGSGAAFSILPSHYTVVWIMRAK